MNMNQIHAFLGAVAAASLALSGCSGTGSPASPVSSATVQPTAPVTVRDPWVKSADSGMTAAFGIIQNTTNQDVTLVDAATPSSPMVELHETVTGVDGGMQMRAKEGGFVVPAGGELVLEPGADHIMLMGLESPIEAGDEITFELRTSDGRTVTFTAQAKDFAGANENYVPEGTGPSGQHSSDHMGHSDGMNGESGMSSK